MDRKTGQRLAVKSIRKSDQAVKPGCLQREIMLLEEMKHSNIIQLVDVFEDDEYLHLVTDLCKGGELFDKIVDKASSGNGCFSEHQAAQILHQILTAVSYLHKRNIVHRDIKPENILFETTAEDSPIKVIDFGLARKHYANKGEPNMTTVVGTPYYIAPEVLRKNYGKACDLWSIGVIAYVLLCGYPPFNGNNNAEVYESVRRGIYWFPSEDWKNVSSGAKDFISRLLQKDPRNRMTVDQALRHPWLIGKLCSENPTTDEKIDSSVEVVYDESFKIDSVLCGGVLNHRMDVC
jgi:calcium-dependent protein kinase